MASFTPAVSGDYAITLNFRQPIEVEEARDLINAATRSDDARARFDFEWQVLDSGKPTSSHSRNADRKIWSRQTVSGLFPSNP
jgi:hypothetical protein